MTVGDRKFTQIPPESTGDRIGVRHSWNLNYKNKTGTFSLKDIITCSTSSLAGTIVHITPITSTTGIIHLVLTHAAEDLINIDSENILVDGYVIAQTNGIGTSTYLNTNAVVGGNNPYFAQSVDIYGSAHIRYRSGNPSLDASGYTRVSNKTLINDYTPVYDIPQTMGIEMIGAGTVSFEDTAKRIHIQTSGTAGDEGLLSSLQYSKYVPGQGHLVEMSVAIGDAGKTNLTRRWGYFDGYNGAFFELADNILYCVKRSDNSGTVLETKFPQSTWSEDTLSGTEDIETNPSGHNINITGLHTYFIDIDLYTGRIKWGIMLNGEHYETHISALDGFSNHHLPPLKSLSLPIRATQTNTGTVGSSSSMYFFSSRIFTEGEFREESLGIPRTYSLSTPITLNADGYFTYALGFRLKDFINGVPNRSSIAPKELSLSFKDGSGNDVPVEFAFFLGTVLTGESWQSPTFSNALEVDEAGTSVFDGIPTGSNFAHGTQIIPTLGSVAGKVNFNNPPTITDARPVYSFFVKNLFPGIYTGVTGKIIFKWVEVE